MSNHALDGHAWYRGPGNFTVTRLGPYTTETGTNVHGKFLNYLLAIAPRQSSNMRLRIRGAGFELASASSVTFRRLCA
jgi:hypothetical protein